ncbi:ketosteroid isomerase-related protein [Palleronia sp. KMU-117]|uniref:ketosteroid isomerase-related protein n=1 Tax=Palleronia sp. KMU-117 TaxID=3434108 RepID=UPI003D744641
MSRDLIQRYFDAFNTGDAEGMLALLTDDVEHHVNQGSIRHGKAAFAEFLAEMDRAYAERVEGLVILMGDDGARAAAEFTIHGTYKATQEGLPLAAGQTYVLPVGTFFTLRDGKIARVTTYYNMADWLRQVGA